MSPMYASGMGLFVVLEQLLVYLEVLAKVSFTALAPEWLNEAVPWLLGAVATRMAWTHIPALLAILAASLDIMSHALRAAIVFHTTASGRIQKTVRRIIVRLFFRR